MTQFSLFCCAGLARLWLSSSFYFFFCFCPAKNGNFFTKWTGHTWLDDTIEELRALRLTDLQAAEEGSIAAGHRQWHTGRAQILGTSRLLTC
jgi:hypothetical protein